MRPGEVLDGRFAIEMLVGSGGMGAVYRAVDRASGQPVAVKVLRGWGKETAARFEREAQLLAALRSPGIVGYFGYGASEDGDTYMVLEWLDGETLKDRLARSPLSLREAVEVVAGIAQAIAPAHDRAVVHRDLKPANVFLVNGPAGRSVSNIKVLDFGIARVIGAESKMTMTGAVLGTPGYMAPEQIRGDKDLDVRCDVYAMGCLLFRCVAGRPPFEANDAVALLMKTATERPPRLKQLRAGVPDRLDALVDAMLRPHPSERPSNARVVSAELTALGHTIVDDLQAPTLDGAPVSALDVPSRSEPSVSRERRSVALGPLADRRRPSRAKWVGIGAAVLVLVFAGGIGIAALMRPPSRGARRRPTTAATAPASSAPAEVRSFMYSVEAPRTAALLPYEKLLRHGRFTDIIGSIDKAFKVGATVNVVAKECGKVEAAYDRATHTLGLCYELARLMRDKLAQIDGITDDALSATVLDAMTFVALHMMGHALLVEGNLAVTGDEEVAVDEFATLASIDAKHPEWVANAAKAMLKLDDLGKVMFVTEHSIAPERVNDILCIVYGSSPATQAKLVGDPLPASRAPSCAAEYERKDRAWTLLLKEHVR